MVSRGTVLPAKILSHFFSIFVYMDSFRWADRARHSSCRFPHCSFSSRSSLYVSRAWCCSHRIINCPGGSFCLLTFKFPNWSSVRLNVSCTLEAMSRRLMSFMVESSWLISVRRSGIRVGHKKDKWPTNSVSTFSSRPGSISLPFPLQR